MLISTLLKNELKENRKLRDNIRCYTIASVNIEDFEKTFGKMPKDELIAFILDDSKFSINATIFLFPIQLFKHF